MVTADEPTTKARTPLSRERILRAAIALADEHGVEALSMRKIGQELGVEAMSLYNHVANKDELLSGVVDLIVEEIEETPGDDDWQIALRRQLLAARTVLAEHPWSTHLIESRNEITPPMLRYFDRVIGILLSGDLSADLTHHALHVLGSRVLGFTQELYDESATGDNPEIEALMMQQMMAEYPNMSAMMAATSHDDADILGDGCDDDFEFAFALDLILDGLERLRLAE